jgi:hypothetical protein
MKERPILFNGEMVRAILEGKKTQTRRIVKYIPSLGEPEQWCHKRNKYSLIGDYRRFCPFGKPGNLLYVRETFGAWPHMMGGLQMDTLEYRADGEYCGDHAENWRWRPSIHMPRWASRIDLVIKNVRIERVNDITEEDAIAEGVKSTTTLTDDGLDYTGLYAAEHFQILWDSINKKRGYGWDKNPWVWVIEFERCN